jgi:hypothetical protein
MNRIQIDISDSVAEHLQREAQTRGVSVAEYVRGLLESQARSHDQWPDAFFERVAGGWKGAALERPAQGELETREQL